MIKNSNVLGDVHTFIEHINAGVVRAGIDMNDLAIMDHVCYRVGSEERYLAMKGSLARIGFLGGETEVNGRMISTFRLEEPITHGGWRVDGVELPAPKIGTRHSEGLEHVEFVIFDRLEDFRLKYPSLDFETRSINRGVNPELGLKLPDSPYTVKFHCLPLLAVVEVVEPAAGITKVYDGM